MNFKIPHEIMKKFPRAKYLSKQKTLSCTRVYYCSSAYSPCVFKAL